MNYSPVIIADTSDMDEATWHTYRTGISGDNLTRLEAQHKNIFDEFATKTESRRVFIKQRSIV